MRGELLRFGRLDDGAPWLSFAHPGHRPFDHLFTVWETDRVPSRWVGELGRYRSVVVPSRWNAEVLAAAGCVGVRRVPLGVSPDLFHPVGRPGQGRGTFTFLWFAHNQYRKGLDVVWAAWRLFWPDAKDCRLVIMGHGVMRGHEGAITGRRGAFVEAELPELGISIREIATPLQDRDVAEVYRAVDVVLCTSRSEGFGFVVAEAMASGVLTVFPDYGATSEFAHEGALVFGGRKVQADYTDLGFADVGSWWEPDLTALVGRMHDARRMSDAERQTRVRTGLGLIRGRYTWRNTVLSLQEALARGEDTVSATPARPRIALPPAKAGREGVAAAIKTRWYATLNRIGYAARSFEIDLQAHGPRRAGFNLLSRVRRVLSRRLRGGASRL